MRFETPLNLQLLQTLDLLPEILYCLSLPSHQLFAPPLLECMAKCEVSTNLKFRCPRSM